MPLLLLAVLLRRLKMGGHRVLIFTQMSKMLDIFDGVLQKVVTREFPHYGRIAKELHVRIIDLPICDKLRDLRQSDLNSLIRVSGVVTRRSSVSPQIKAHLFECERCGSAYGPYESSSLRPMGCQSAG